MSEGHYEYMWELCENAGDAPIENVVGYLADMVLELSMLVMAQVRFPVDIGWLAQMSELQRRLGKIGMGE